MGNASGGNNRNGLKTIVRGAYDLQVLRIQMGNRVVASFKAKLGQAPSMSEETLDDVSKKILAKLRVGPERLTDTIIANAKSLDVDVPDADELEDAEAEEVKPEEKQKKQSDSQISELINKLLIHRYLTITEQRKSFPTRSKFQGDPVISDYTEMCLVAQYVDLVKSEDMHFRRLGMVLQDFKIFNEFLDKIKGIGPAMAGVIISEIDITKAKYPSSLHAFAGLDVVSQWKLKEVVPTRGTPPADLIKAIPETQPLHFTTKESEVVFDQGRQFLTVQHRDLNWCAEAVYEQVSLGGRSKRKEHLVKRKYIDKNGVEQERDSITYNPFLKTKLVGVLGGLFLKAGNERYGNVYYAYKNRMENRAIYGKQNDKKKDDAGKIITSPARRHRMATRYMIKIFLIDYYVAARTIEGLPVSEPYAVAKLKMPRHGEEKEK